MYIEPKTNIKLLSNVPLDTTYEHTLSWEKDSTGVIAQNTYFVGQTKYNLTDYNYVRVANGVARVGIPAENLYDCNYMMFQNTAFGNKWFYAFITDIIYLNNGTTEIRFTIDDMQTWYFNFELDDCFIEREHTATDVIGEHIEPEPVATGEYVRNSYDVIGRDLSNLAVIICVIDGSASGKLYDNIYSGYKLTAFLSDDIDGISTYLTNYYTTPDQVLNMYMCPKGFINQEIVSGGTELISGGIANKEAYYSVSTVSSSSKIDGYTPNNKKLYTYPFNYFGVFGGNSSLSLRYEFFTDLTVKLTLASTITYPVIATLYPYDYKNSGDNWTEPYLDESIQINGFPICSWSMDAYKVYIAQNSLPLFIGATASMLSTGISGNPRALASTTVGEIANILISDYKASIQADIYKGNFDNGNINSVHGWNSFKGGRISVTHQQAKIIDDFFTKYGYAVNIVKKPDWRSRPHYNYIKTVNCTATGSIPSDAMRNICHLFDNGITFWKVPAEVGQYNTVDNRV